MRKNLEEHLGFMHNIGAKTAEELKQEGQCTISVKGMDTQTFNEFVLIGFNKPDGEDSDKLEVKVFALTSPLHLLEGLESYKTAFENMMANLPPEQLIPVMARMVMEMMSNED